MIFSLGGNSLTAQKYLIHQLRQTFHAKISIVFINSVIDKIYPYLIRYSF